MIRLAMCGIDEKALPAVGIRLRGASIVAVEDCEAIALLDSSPRAIDAAERNLRAKKHVMLPSTACHDLSILDRLASSAQNAGRQLATINPAWYLPSRWLIAGQIQDGKIGDVGLVRIHHWTSSSHPDLRWQRGDLCDEIDLASWLIGSEPQVLYANGASGGSYRQVHLGFSGGAMALINCTEDLPAPDGYHSLSVIGSCGAAYADDHQNVNLRHEDRSTNAVVQEEGARQAAAMVQTFVDGLEKWYDFSLHVSDRRRALLIGEAAQRSLEARHAVLLKGV